MKTNKPNDKENRDLQQFYLEGNNKQHGTNEKLTSPDAEDQSIPLKVMAKGWPGIYQ